jgi:hypothetical protein
VQSEIYNYTTHKQANMVPAVVQKVLKAAVENSSKNRNFKKFIFQKNNICKVLNIFLHLFPLLTR